MDLQIYVLLRIGQNYTKEHALSLSKSSRLEGILEDQAEYVESFRFQF